MTNRYDIRLSRGAQRALSERLPSSVAFAAWELIDGRLRDRPQLVGKPLGPPFKGCWSARRGSYRVRYTIDEAEEIVSILDIAGRADAYHVAAARTGPHPDRR